PGFQAQNRKKILKDRNNTSSRSFKPLPYFRHRLQYCYCYRDRLCRFTFDLLEFVFKLNGTKIVVLSEDNPTDEWELSQDILAINTVFICRLQGKHSAEWKQGKKQKTREESANNTTSQKN